MIKDNTVHILKQQQHTTTCAWLQASAAMEIAPALFWDFKQRRVENCWRRFGITYWSHIQMLFRNIGTKLPFWAA